LNTHSRPASLLTLPSQGTTICLIVFFLEVFVGSWESWTQAQAPPITSSGLNTQISAPVNLPSGAIQHNITGGTRPGGGGNLFHSFGEFGVPTNHIANFLNDSGLPTNNILSRVTGGNPSNIFGTIQTQGFGNANLYLMNPAGIVFGPNASLNVGGAAHFTTADYLRLADGVQFTALPGPQDALLSVAPVEAFGFLGSTPAGISVEGSTLSVSEGQTLSLVGGGMTIGGHLNAPGGNIAIASVASSGEAPITDSGRVELFDIQGQPLFPALGGIEIVPGSLVEVSGNTAGTISIRGGKLTVTDSLVLAGTVHGDAAPVGIDVHVSDDAQFFGGPLGQSLVFTWSEGIGNAGDLIIQAKNYLQKGDETRRISMGSTKFWTGHGGDVTVKASESITVEGSYTEIGSGIEGGGTGDGGDVLIEAPLVNVQGGGLFNRAPGDGNGGTLTIKADDVLVTSRFDIDLVSVGRLDTVTFGAGRGGDLNIFARNSVIITDLAQIPAQTYGTNPNAGNGGNILIEAPTIDIRSALISTETHGPGQGGTLTLRATDAISISHLTSVFTQSLSTEPLAGKGGDVLLEAPIVNVSGSIINTNSFGPGNGGDVTLIGTEQVTLSGIATRIIYDGPDSHPLFADGPRPVAEGTTSLTWPFGFVLPDEVTVQFEHIPTELRVSSEGSGSGGNVTIQTPSLLVSDQALITAENTGDGAAGNVLLQVGALTTAAGATIETSTTGAGKAGNIITQGLGGPGTLPNEVTLIDTTINTSATSTGAGGEIIIGTGGSTPLRLTNTTISASVHDMPAGTPSDQGIANIALSGPTITIKGGRLIADTTGTRQGGDLLIRSDQSLNLTNAAVSVASSGPANAGNILIQGGGNIAMDHTQVSADASQGSGGNIKLTADEMIHLVDSTIESSVQGDALTVGGDISLDPDFIVLQNTQILAKAAQGQGGNISLIANDAVLVDPFSVLDASSALGVSGSVNIQAPTKFLSGAITPLPQEFIQTADLYSSRCLAYKDGQLSSFVQGRHDTVPPQPEDLWASPLFPASAMENPLPLVGQSGSKIPWADRLGFGDLLTGLSADAVLKGSLSLRGCRA